MRDSAHRDRYGNRASADTSASTRSIAPGRETLTSRLEQRLASEVVRPPSSQPTAEPSAPPGDPFAIHLKSRGARASDDAGALFVASTTGAASEVPYRAEMERAFGEDFSGVRAHVGGSAVTGLDAMGARAAAHGDAIAFAHSSPDRELVAHELTHVVQQRRGGATTQGKGGFSDPGDPAEREADDVARRVVGGEHVTVSAAPTGAVHRDIKEAKAPVPLGDFAINMKKVEDADFQGEDGTVSFTPNDKAPDSKSIKLTQAIRYFDLGTKKDYDWTGSTEANRSKMNTKGSDAKVTTTASDTLGTLSLQHYGEKARYKEIYEANKAALKSDNADDAIGAGVVLTIPGAVGTGVHVDHFPSDPKAKVRGKAGDPNVPQEYVWPGEENAKDNHHGSKAGKTLVPAILSDRPGWTQDMKYTFETAARSDDIGVYYGAMHWGFTIKSNKVVDENHHVAEGVSDTFRAAVTEFNKFYKNQVTVMQGDTLESLAERYLGSKAKADDIYNANKAKIPDKAHLVVGIQLDIPGVSA